jgi:hypothetical protein
MFFQYKAVAVIAIMNITKKMEKSFSSKRSGIF